MSSSLLFQNTALVLGLMSILWLISVRLQDVSIVDPFWSIAFLLVTLNTALHTELTPAKALLLGMVSVWSLRLFIHLFLRSHNKPEDPRYAAFRQRFGAQRYWWLSFFQVFLLQGILVLLISAPLQLAAGASKPDPITPFTLSGLAVFLAGFIIEARADAQLQAFRDDPARRGAVLDTGLWRYSRHPNYFGEALLWWGFWLAASGRAHGVVCVLSPLLMTFLLVKVSGVALLDAHLSERKPGYAEYIRKTPGFVPWWPRP